MGHRPRETEGNDWRSGKNLDKVSGLDNWHCQLQASWFRQRTREKTFLDVKENKKSLLCGELLAIDDYLWSKGQRVHVNLGAKMLLPILNMILVIVRGSQNC